MKRPLYPSRGRVTFRNAFFVLAGGTLRNFVTGSRLPILAAITGVAAMLNAHAAAAQSASETSPVSQPPAFCKGSTLTGKKLMRLVRRIVAHGDLTDIAFNEKIFRTKFREEHDKAPDGTPEQGELIYQADEILGEPIRVVEYVNHLDGKQRNNLIAKIIIGNLSLGDQEADFLKDCVTITKSEFSSFFGGNFIPSVVNDAPPPNELGSTEGAPGKNNSKIYLNFGFLASGEEAPVTVVYIDQLK